MVRSQSHSKFLILIQCLTVVIMIIMPSVICYGFWNPTRAPEDQKSYLAIVKKRIPRLDDHITGWLCQGAIINSRYVLTAIDCTEHGTIRSANLSVVVGYSYVGPLVGSRKSRPVIAGEYIADSVYAVGLLGVIKTKDHIEFNDRVTCIDLPKGEYYAAWENRFGIPNHVRYDSSYWCRDQNTTDYYLYYRSGVRNCSYSEIYATPKMFISTCLDEKSSAQVCRWMRGTPLVYNNTLIGIRMEVNNFNQGEDLFINVVRHVNKIGELMYGYVPCPK